MLNSISRACIQQAVHVGSLCVTTTISVVRVDSMVKTPCRHQVLNLWPSNPDLQILHNRICPFSWIGSSWLGNISLICLFKRIFIKSFRTWIEMFVLWAACRENSLTSSTFLRLQDPTLHNIFSVNLLSEGVQALKVKRYKSKSNFWTIRRFKIQRGMNIF